MRLAVAMLLMAAASLVAQEPVAQDPVTSRDWLNRGVRAFREARYADAVDAFQKAVQVDPSFLTARLYLGTAYLQMYIPGADSPENNSIAANAHAEFEKVLVIDSKNAVALVSDASLYLNQKQWDSARRGFEKVTALNPNNADAWYSLGFIAWSTWYPAYTQGRRNAGMKPEDPGPSATRVYAASCRRNSARCCRMA